MALENALGCSRSLSPYSSRVELRLPASKLPTTAFLMRSFFLTAVFGLLSILVSNQATLAQGVIQTLDQTPETNWHRAGFWETIDGQPIESSWEFENDEVRLIKPRGGRGSLVSRPLPPNFELSWDWKIDTKTNTGLKYRVRKFGGRYLGVEYQIIDETPGKGKGKGSTASIYDLVAPFDDKPLMPAGHWNHAKVVAIGHRLEHYLNGKLVATTQTVGPHWDQHVALSKFYGLEDFGRPRDGDRIMLTDHGGTAVYRNFQFVTRQPEEQSEPTVLNAPQLGNGMRNSWADQDSIVLWTRTTARPEMISDGPRFHSLSKADAGRLAKSESESDIHRQQIPSGSELSEIFGAMPGASGEVRLTYFPKLNRNSTKSTDWVKTTAANDFTTQWRLDGLQPGKNYAAVIESRDPESGELTCVLRGHFQTAPPAKKRQDLSFCVTTCHDFIRRDDGAAGHKIYPVMSSMQPDFVVHAGDIEYYDKPDPWAMTLPLMRFKWGRIFALPSNRAFYNDTTSYFLKDDHDTLKNDCWVGQRYGSVTFEEGVKLFNEEQFPSHSPRYKTVRWGKDLQVWFLEGRDYRSPNNIADGPEKTILGKEQRDWLFETLAKSDAKFKLIFSPTPIVGPDRANKKDNHANENFVHEGNLLRDEFARHDGVIVLCGDRHWQYASVDEETNLWEFGCGPGSEKHQLGWKQGDERPKHRFLRVAGGFLSGELQYEQGDSQLTLRHHKVTGEPVSEFVFPTE